jgi:hypothetical protein
MEKIVIYALVMLYFSQKENTFILSVVLRGIILVLFCPLDGNIETNFLPKEIIFETITEKI